MFAGDPAAPNARAEELSYLPPPGYRPTEIAELPDGALLILHRRFSMPLNFSTILSILPRDRLMPGRPIRARALALFKAPGVHENFEGSDDNFAALQKTYLLKFALGGG